ncbi:MAG: CHASE2 domain-containing protein [Desulfobacca sp.]|uniref:CHASE2 domain-containing protein n=1 Tax=Desulfobacca sp. TaxID=2067990 RepID=UPI004048EFE0
MLFGQLAFWLLAPLSFLPLGTFLENLALDFCYQWRPSSPSAADILVVGIDEPSFQELRRTWPWPRSWHAQLVERLKAAGARVIVFDIVFAEPSIPEEDREFAAALRRAGNVVLASTIEVAAGPRFRRQILVRPLPELAAAAAGVGLALVTPDHDGVVRRFAASLAGQESVAVTATRLFKPELAIPPSLTGLINFVGPARSLPTVSYYQVIAPDRPLPSSWLQDKIVLVGRMLEANVTPQGQADMFYTPYFSLDGHLMAGVEIQGQIINTLLQDIPGHSLSARLRVLLYLFLFTLAGYAFGRLSPLVGAVVLSSSSIVLFGGSFYLFWQRYLWLPPVLLFGGMVLVYGGNALCHYAQAAKDKRWLRQAFSRYVSSALVEIISSHPEQLRLGGEEVEVTVLFADLAGFTMISEGLTPEKLIQLLNEYFTTMTDIILARRGTLDKYIGDAIMAFWGAPLSLPEHASLACATALAMQQALHPLQEAWQEQGLPSLEVRIGLHTGPAIVGNVGSRERFNYTVMGDTVNLASRLEGVNKIYGTKILISDATFGQVQADFLCREVDLVQVKGRFQPVAIYELLGHREDQPRFPWLATFAAALTAYRQGRWQEADELFQEVLAQQPGDPPSLCLRQRLQTYKQQPPPAWQGVHKLEIK